jgi:hypothetical protein
MMGNGFQKSHWMKEDYLDEVDVDIPLPLETNISPPIQLNLGENPVTSSDIMISCMMRKDVRWVRRKEYGCTKW